MQVALTDVPGIWRLTYERGLHAGTACSVLETSLLRHRPPSILPISWFPQQDGCLLLMPHSSGLAPLSEFVSTMSDKADVGYLLLRRVMEAIDEARDHLLTVEPSMLCPELIFCHACLDESTLPIVSLICLPFPYPVCEEKRDHSVLIEFLSATFHWDSMTTDRFRALFEKRAYYDLLLDLRSMSDQSELELTRSNQSSAKQKNISDPVPNPYKRKKCSWLIRLFGPFIRMGQSILGQNDYDSVHETTDELDLSCDQFRIAQLSEGLPGTPEEELGQHVYILTEDFIIGRHMRDAGLWIDSSAISRRHARITRQAGSYFIEDLGSKNGTTMDGIRLNRHREYLLPNKCRVAFAGKVFYFRSD